MKKVNVYENFLTAYLVTNFSFYNCITKMRNCLGVFDFDHTIINENSDAVVKNMLRNEEVPDQINHLALNGKWTAYMREIFSLLHQKGISQDNFRQVITEIPAVPYFVLFLKKLKEIGCDIIIISDSNTYFIEEWLKFNEIKNCVDAVYSNPAMFVGGKLNIREFHIQDWCSLSEVNLCKGYVLEKHLENQEKQGIVYDTVFYVGDGRNDLCPTLKLRENDFVFPRIGYPLLDIINTRQDIKALVSPWTTTNDILAILQTLNS